MIAAVRSFSRSRLLREVHGVLLAQGRGSVKQPGEFRTALFAEELELKAHAGPASRRIAFRTTTRFSG